MVDKLGRRVLLDAKQILNVLQTASDRDLDAALVSLVRGKRKPKRKAKRKIKRGIGSY